MATTKTPAAAAPDPADDDADADPGGGDEGEDQGGPTVLLTVMNNHDGTYVLIKGDEDEDEGDEAGEAESMAGEGEDEGQPAAGEEPGAGAEGGEDKGETFDSVSALLKGILDVVKESEAEETGDGSEDDNFNAGFTGGSAASPARGAVGAAVPAPTMAQKY